MSWLLVRDLGDSTHSGFEDYGHVRVAAYSLQGCHQL